MDLQILYNNPSKKKRKENPSMRTRKKKNPVNVYRKARTESKKPIKGPSIRFGKVDFPSLEQRQARDKAILDALTNVEENIKDPKAKAKALKKYQDLRTKYRKSLANRIKSLTSEEDSLKNKGYISDKTISIKEAKSKLREEAKAIEDDKRNQKKIESDIAKLLAKTDKSLGLSTGKRRKKKKTVASKKAVKKVVRKKKRPAKKAKKKVAKKSTAKKASGKKKVSHKKKKVSRKSKASKGRRVRRKKNPITVLSNPSKIEVMENPNKKGSKKKSKKVSKKKTKKSSKKKSKKASKKKSKGIIEGLKDVFSSKKKKSSKKSKKASYKAKGAKKFKKGKKYKVKNNPGVSMAKSKFEKITKHDGMEVAGLAGGAAALQAYNGYVKPFILSKVPFIASMYSKVPAGALPMVDGLVDVLLAGGVAHLASKYAPGEKMDAVTKGIIGAAVVSLSMKATVALGNATIGPMQGIIGVPSMNGIIAVPAGMGAITMESDFQGMGASGMTNSDFGGADMGTAYIQDADYGSESMSGSDVEYSDESEDSDF